MTAIPPGHARVTAVWPAGHHRAPLARRGLAQTMPVHELRAWSLALQHSGAAVHVEHGPELPRVPAQLGLWRSA